MCYTQSVSNDTLLKGRNMTVSDIAEKLYTTRLFKNIKGLENIISSHAPVEIRLSAGEKYEIKNSLALFLKGKADIVKESDSRTAYMKTVSDTALLGLATLFSDESEYISTLVAKSESILLLFSEEFVKAVIKADADFSLRLVTLLCQKVRYLNRRIDFYTCQGAEDKVHEFLQRTSDADGRIVMSMSKMSETLGIARASLYRALTALEEKGCIVRNGKKIQLIK